MKQKFFELAKKLSKYSDHAQHKLGTVIVQRNKIVSVGFNKAKTHPKSNHTFFSTHAELDAILHSGKDDLSGCDIYIYRETKQGELANSYPCIYCQALLKKWNIKSIWYTDSGVFKHHMI